MSFFTVHVNSQGHFKWDSRPMHGQVNQDFSQHHLWDYSSYHLHYFFQQSKQEKSLWNLICCFSFWRTYRKVTSFRPPPSVILSWNGSHKTQVNPKIWANHYFGRDISINHSHWNMSMTQRSNIKKSLWTSSEHCTDQWVLRSQNLYILIYVHTIILHLNCNAIRLQWKLLPSSPVAVPIRCYWQLQKGFCLTEVQKHRQEHRGIEFQSLSDSLTQADDSC